MTNEEAYREFTVYFNGHPEHRLCVETDAQYLTRLKRVETHDLRPYTQAPKVKSRALVLAAVPSDHYVTSWTITRKVCLTASQVSGELWALTQQGKLTRQRRFGKWEYKRTREVL